jgi:hypothetical protein
MTLISCPECAKSVSEKAKSCPHCGYPLKSGGGLETGYAGYEYKSSATLFGMPLIHVVYGPGAGGTLKPAKGFIAIGNVAIGVIAIGARTLQNDPQFRDYIQSLFKNIGGKFNP